VDDANVDALDFDGRRAATEVMAKALVTTKDPVDGGAKQSGLAPLDSRSLADFTGTRVMKTRLTATVDDAGELRDRAASLLREVNWFVKCEGELICRNSNRPARWLAGAGQWCGQAPFGNLLCVARTSLDHARGAPHEIRPAAQRGGAA